jgi:hypothetical protein
MNKECKLIIAANWKCNKTVAEALDLVTGLKRELAAVKQVASSSARPSPRSKAFPAPFWIPTSRLGAQNFGENGFGTFTGNISYRLGHGQNPEAIRESIKSEPGAEETFHRMLEHLQANEVDVMKDKVTLGLVLSFNPTSERFNGNAAADEMLKLHHRNRSWFLKSFQGRDGLKQASGTT